MAAMALLSQKPRQGFSSRKPALHPGIDECNSTVAIGLRAGERWNRVGSRYTGKERDSESGNDYFGARYFASTTGRFMSPDSDNPQPTNNPQRLNLYTYALNNPLRFIDEDGYTAVDRVNRATSLVGKPYGHNDQPNKYDCSGLAQFSVGSDLSNFPGTGATQYSYADTNGAFTADPSQVQAGDEVFFQNDKGDVVHVGVVEWVDPKTGAIHIVAAAGTKKGVVKQTLPGKGNAGTVWGPQTIKGYGLWHNFDQGASQSKPPRNLWNGIQNLLEQGLFSQRTPPEPPPPPPSGGNSPGAIPTASRWWF
jgi:RHS repeat-associated protein